MGPGIGSPAGVAVSLAIDPPVPSLSICPSVTQKERQKTFGDLTGMGWSMELGIAPRWTVPRPPANDIVRSPVRRKNVKPKQNAKQKRPFASLTPISCHYPAGKVLSLYISQWRLLCRMVDRLPVPWEKLCCCPMRAMCWSAVTCPPVVSTVIHPPPPCYVLNMTIC
jgi:hypothetical protein